MEMRIAMLSWESLHAICVGGGGVHVTELGAALERRGHEVHVFTRMGRGQAHYERIDGVHYHRCPFDLNPNFMDEINNMCRSFVHHAFQTEDYIGGFDVIHAHDWLTGNALIWIKQGRRRKSFSRSTPPSTAAAETSSGWGNRRAFAIRNAPRRTGR